MRSARFIFGGMRCEHASGLRGCCWPSAARLFFAAVTIVIIHAAAGFATQASGVYVLQEQRGRAVFFAERFVQIFQNIQAHVEAHQIHQLERAHRMIEAELQRFVYIFGRGDALPGACRKLRCRSWR